MYNRIEHIKEMSIFVSEDIALKKYKFTYIYISKITLRLFYHFVTVLFNFVSFINIIFNFYTLENIIYNTAISLKGNFQ